MSFPRKLSWISPNTMAQKIQLHGPVVHNNFLDSKRQCQRTKCGIAAYHLEGDAQLWFQRKKQLNQSLAWEKLIEGLEE